MISILKHKLCEEDRGILGGTCTGLETITKKKYDEKYLLMKCTNILAKLLDEDIQNNHYRKLESRVEAKMIIGDIEAILEYHLGTKVLIDD